ncbi:MAG TPA: porin family protein [Flavobacteriales bacterium]
MRPLRTIILLPALAAITISMAQVAVGGKVGFNYAIGSQKIQPDPKDPPTNPKGMGFAFGAYAEIPFSDLVGIRPELGFSFRRLKTESTAVQDFENAGVTVNGQQGTFTGKQTQLTETDQRLQYFQLNAPLTISPSEGFRIMVGPSFGFLMGGKQNSDVTLTTEGTATVNGQEQSIKEESFETSKKKGSAAIRNFRKMDVAAMAGLGYTLGVGLDLDLRFYRSVVTTYDESAGSSRYRIWTNLVEFSMGWTFGK